MKCTQCHIELSEELGGNCPACLLQGAVREDFGGEGQAYGTPFSEIGDYEILEEIGRGGAGVVYRARHRKLKRLAALKALHGGVLGSAEAFERFRIEAQAVARLDHPNIVPLFETGAENGTHYLTLRYFERGSLAKELERRVFTPEEAARLIGTAARAIHYAHQRGVLHRDLKPSNLLLGEEGEAHITDFGLAKLSDNGRSLTLSSSVLGTPNYMAPEQADGRAKNASVAVDIYSLGAILFELLTQRPPFIGDTPLSVLRQVADEDPPRPRALNPALDPDLEAVCLRCLEKEPERRYASAAALADDLQRWLKGEQISVRATTAVERVLRWMRRRPVVAALCGALVVTLVAGMAGTFWQWRVARRTAEKARADSYFTAMDLIARTYRTSPQTAKQILDRYRPARGETDLRGWEWRYFWAACRGEKPERKSNLAHSVPLYSVALSQDEKFLAVGQVEGGVHILDAKDFTPIYESPPGANTIISPWMPSGNVIGARVISIPGASLFAWSETTSVSNTVVKFWSIDDRKVVRELPQPYIVRNLAISADGRRLIVECQSPFSKTVVWDLDTGEIIAEATRGLGMSNYAYTNPMAVSRDGRYLAIEDFPGTVRVFDIETQRDRWRLPLTDQYLLASAFSPDGKMLAVSAGFGSDSVQLWNLESGQLDANLRSTGWASRLAFTQDGAHLIGASGQSIVSWEVTARRLNRTIFHRLGGFPDFALTADGTRLYAASDQGEVSCWNPNAAPAKRAEGKLSTIFGGHIRFIPGTEHLIGATSNRFLAEIGLDGEKVLSSAPTNITSADVLPDGTAYLAGLADGSVTLRSRANHQVLRSFGGLTELPRLLRAFPTSKSVVASGNHLTRVWDLETGQVRFDLPSPPADAWAEATPDEKTWTVLWFDGRVLTANLMTGETKPSELPFSKATVIAYSPDGKYAVTSGVHCPARLYTADLRYIRDLGEIGLNGGFSAAFSSDSRRIVLGYGGDVRIIDVSTGRSICVLRAPIDLAFATSFSTEGNTLALVGSVYRQVYLWFAPSWNQIEDIEAAGAY